MAFATYHKLKAFVIIQSLLVSSVYGAVLPESKGGSKIESKPSDNDIRDTDCSEDPHHTDLHANWVSHHDDQDMHSSWYMLPILRRDIAEALDSEGRTVSIHVSGDRSVDCSVRPTNALGSPLAERSLCPWYHVINHDPARYPSDLVEARCSCSNCAGLDDSSAVCEPIHYNVLVLRRTDACANGKKKWERGWQKLAVGCSCARRPNV